MMGARYDNPGRPFSRRPSSAHDICTVRSSKNMITPTRQRS